MMPPGYSNPYPRAVLICSAHHSDLIAPRVVSSRRSVLVMYASHLLCIEKESSELVSNSVAKK